MEKEQAILAWNNLMQITDPLAFPVGDIRRSAVISSLYMGLTNNGGINSLFDMYSRT